MIKDSTTKYKLDYQPNKDIPLNVLSYIFMIIQRTPLLWTCLLSSDFIHILRYPLAFYLMGLTIDLLTQQSTTEFVPDNVWLYVGLIFLVLFVGEISHLISHYFTFDLLRQARAELRSDLMAYTLDHSVLYFLLGRWPQMYTNTLKYN